MMCAGVTKSGSPTSSRITSGTSRARSAMTRMPECGVVVMARATSGIAQETSPRNRRWDENMLLHDPERSRGLGVVRHVCPCHADFGGVHRLFKGILIIEPLLHECVSVQSPAGPAHHLCHDVAAHPWRRRRYGRVNVDPVLDEVRHAEVLAQ